MKAKSKNLVFYISKLRNVSFLQKLGKKFKLVEDEVE
jgi:hypothetical protein